MIDIAEFDSRKPPSAAAAVVKTSAAQGWIRRGVAGI